MKMQDVLTEKLKDINVSEKELKILRELANDVVLKLNKKKVKAFVGGSLAKGTLIKKEEQDIDIFIVFENEEEVQGFEKILKKIKFSGRLKKVHGSRDYFQILNSVAKIELIPTVETKNPEDAQNVTDVSLSHVKYVSGMINKNKGLAGEIKLAKAFCQAQGFYGAESYIKGFSGYSLEILVIHFGSFNNFLKAILKIGKGKKGVIDSKKYFKNAKEVLYELNASKLKSPLVVIDPTYKYRNVNAGLGEETFEKFLDVVKQFLKKPSKGFFEKKDIDVIELKKFAVKHKASLLEINLRSDRQEGDIVGTKCRKFLDFFINELKRNGQDVTRKEFYYSGSGQNAVGYLVVKEKKIVEVRGPPVKMKESVKGFKKEHKKTFVKKGMVWAKKKVSIKEVFEYANRVKIEMGSWGEKLVEY